MTDRLYDLAALDMDGTLLNSTHEITPFTRDVLNRADAAGKVVALCTGRCLSELWTYLARMPGISYAINESGGCLYDVRADRILRQATLDDAVIERLFDLAAPRDVMLQCFISNQSYVQPGDIGMMARYHIGGFEEAFEAGSIFTPDIRALWHAGGKPMTKFNLYFASEAEKAIFDGQMGELDLCVTGCLGIGYELSPKGAGKDDGLRALCDHLGIPVTRAMAVGDGNNDIGLMAAAGLSVAMGNAVEAVRQVADTTTEDCDHDGAARAVLRYMLGIDD